MIDYGELEAREWLERADYLASLKPPVEPAPVEAEWTASAADYTALSQENDALRAELAQTRQQLTDAVNLLRRLRPCLDAEDWQAVMIGMDVLLANVQPSEPGG
jgi:hypothetical protein